MKGDFSIDRFDPTKHFSRVLKQQGRVDMDSDWNEQVDIARHHLTTLIVDLFGRAAGPRDHCLSIVDYTQLTDAQKAEYKNAGLTPEVGDFFLSSGRYYVDGLLVENEKPLAYSGQTQWKGPKLTANTSYLVYLDVWERHVTWIQDDSIREVALGGPDTCTRVQTAWQLKVMEVQPDSTDQKADLAPTGTLVLAGALAATPAATAPAPAAAAATPAPPAAAPVAAPAATGEPVQQVPERLNISPCAVPIGKLRGWKSGKMTARLQPATSDSPCVLSPDSKYRGLENQLYRVEIHRGSDNPDNDPPSFKWSRENGSVATPWLESSGTTIKVASSRGFSAGDWVEIIDTTAEYQGDPGTLHLVQTVDRGTLTLDSSVSWDKNNVDPLVRRWDQKANDEQKLDQGAIDITKEWIEIEGGIEVQFTAGNYRTGDYWLIPARVVTGDIIWPTVNGQQASLEPLGVEHHYAALGIVKATAADPYISIVDQCLCRFAPLSCIATLEKL